MVSTNHLYMVMTWGWWDGADGLGIRGFGQVGGSPVPDLRGELQRETTESWVIYHGDTAGDTLSY